jgi:G3E family GTPase
LAVANGEPADREISVTLVSGYLGAGKTTRINQLLARGPERCAVLVNDFGAINVDAALIERRGVDVLALQGGCVCCAIADDLAAAIGRVLALRPRIRSLVIEASGVSDPAKIAAQCSSFAALAPAVTVVLVDCSRIRGLARDKFVGPLVQQQLRAADRLLLSRLDRVSAEEAAAVREWLAAQGGAVEVADLHEIFLKPASSRRSSASEGTVAAGAPEDAAARFVALHCRVSGVSSEADLLGWLARRPAEVVRLKGIVELGRAPRELSGKRCVVVQATPQEVTIEPFLAPDSLGLGAASRRAEGVLSCIARALPGQHGATRRVLARWFREVGVVSKGDVDE